MRTIGLIVLLIANVAHADCLYCDIIKNYGAEEQNKFRIQEELIQNLGANRALLNELAEKVAESSKNSPVIIGVNPGLNIGANSGQTDFGKSLQNLFNNR